MINVLFLCTHNSARSVVAEVLLNTLAKGKFTGFSAGSSPKTDINPIAFELTKIAQQMHDGFRGIDENGNFPLLEYCGA